MITAPPMRTIDWEGPGGATGHLVIDRLVGGRALGGLRVIADPSRDETVAMARTMSRKYAFIGHAIGGAKAAVRVAHGMSPEERSNVIRAFGAHVGEELRSGSWTPALDMGCEPSDLADLCQGAGLPSPNHARSRHRSHVYTAWTVHLSVREALRALGRDLHGATVAVEGFGRVGSVTAELLADDGASIVAASDLDAAIHDPNGLDVGSLLAARRQLGDGCLSSIDAPRVPHDSIATLDVDVFIPSARAWTVDNRNVDEVRARAVVCAANAPMTDRIQQELCDRGVVVVPDFVANCGGVFGSEFDRHVRDPWILERLRAQFAPRLEDLLAASRRDGITVTAAADVAAPLDQAAGDPATSKIRRAAARAVPALPVAVRERLLRRYSVARMFPEGAGGR